MILFVIEMKRSIKNIKMIMGKSSKFFNGIFAFHGICKNLVINSRSKSNKGLKLI